MRHDFSLFICCRATKLGRRLEAWHREHPDFSWALPYSGAFASTAVIVARKFLYARGLDI